MALLRCPDCSREISDQAPMCPGCGAPGLQERQRQAQLQHAQAAHHAAQAHRARNASKVQTFILVGSLLSIGGCITTASGCANPSGSGNTVYVGFGMLFTGFVVFVIGRVMAPAGGS